MAGFGGGFGVGGGNVLCALSLSLFLSLSLCLSSIPKYNMGLTAKQSNKQANSIFPRRAEGYSFTLHAHNEHGGHFRRVMVGVVAVVLLGQDGWSDGGKVDG